MNFYPRVWIRVQISIHILFTDERVIILPDLNPIRCHSDLLSTRPACVVQTAWTSGACGPARPCPDVTGSHPLPTVAGELIKQGSKWEWDAEAASRRSTAQPAPLTHCLIQPWLFKNSAGDTLTRMKNMGAILSASYYRVLSFSLQIKYVMISVE
jgi:hypothetical protein